MCGIAGFCNPRRMYTRERRRWISVLNTMNRTQKHRGPDDEGVYLSRGCGLAHVRLSIIDLHTGHQPMCYRRGGREVTIVYNGEIYNMHALKKELKAEGVSFETTSDTEVILRGYLKYGADYVKQLNGIFAFGIWDTAINKLFLFRDRMGVKPLFYTNVEDTIVFGSELKALFAYPGCKPKLDKESFQEILGLGPAKTYGKGVFAGVREVPAGGFMEIGRDGVHTHTYWCLESHEHTDGYKETVEKTAFLLEDAVKMQMLSDIPISTFLSGGVDSSLVTAICAKELHTQGGQLNTFSFDFVDNDKNFKASSFQPSQDRPWVDKMVEHCGTNHRYLECENRMLADYLYEAVDARDLPCMTDIESSLLYFCKKVVDYNKVTLTGECADEIFGGYPWFHKQEMLEGNGFPWSMDMEPRELLLKDEVKEALQLGEYVQETYEKSVNETPLLQGETTVERKRRQISYLNLKWFMVTLLDRMDRTSMYSGLEARVPFADHRIVEYIWNVPWSMKCPDGQVKGLLRAAGEGFLPEEVLYRKKSPYPKTYDPVYEQILTEQMQEVLHDANAPILTYIDKEKMETFLQAPKDYGKPWYGQLMAGPQMIAYWLQINYWMRKYHLH